MPLTSHKQTLRLVQRSTSPDEALFQANDYLSTGHHEKAIQYYTEVLYKSSPASICAFLNRSLAYASFQLPELAVVDAYRAGIVANQMRKNADNGEAKFQAAVSYLRTEKLHVERRQRWADSQYRFIGGECWYSALSSLVLNDVPESQGNEGPSYQYFTTSKRSIVCNALEIRSIYRLCAALDQCGGGARADALGLIDDALHACRAMQDWERAYFQRLGNFIIADLMQPWDDGLSDSQALVSISKNMRRKQDEEKQKTRESMKAKTTMLRLSGYHWDEHEPDLDCTHWRLLLQSWVSRSSSNCAAVVVQSEDILDETTAPYAELRADQGINAGELVLAESTVSNVTTSIPEEVFEDQITSSVRRFYCDTCSSLLLVPVEASVKYKGTKVPLPTPSSPSLSSTSVRRSPHSMDLEDAMYGNTDGSPDVNPVTSSQPNLDKNPSSKIPVRPSSLPRSHSTPVPTETADFMFCCPTHDVPTCSASCRIGREPFDHGLCHTSIERELRNAYLLGQSSPESLAARKSQCLVDLLFLRHFAKAFNTRNHPLQSPKLMLATCGPSHQGALDVEREWSFMANVVRPIRYLEQFFEQTDTDQFAHLEYCDGWLINTLISKITTSMRISQSPRYAKLFNLDGNLVSAFTPFNDLWNEITQAEPMMVQENDDAETWKDQNPWIGSIHPIFNMIRIADSTKGEIPNVVFVQREGIQCYAISRNGLEPAIRKGEPLLRAADGLTQDDSRGGSSLRRLLRGRGSCGDGGGGGDKVLRERDVEQSNERVKSEEVPGEDLEMKVDSDLEI